MKRLGRIAVCLAGGLALNAGLLAAGPASANNPLPDNPYATIAARNIFGLVAPPPPDDPAKDAEKNLPKIKPTGIMSVFGQSKVLFQVAAGAATKPRQQAKEEFYILSQGQREDDIEVIKIDEKNSLVTFDNHGTTQELPLANAPDSGAFASSPPGPGNPGMPGPGNPGMTRGRRGGGGNSGPGGFTQFGAGPGGRSGGMGNGAPGFNSGAGNGANNGMDFGGSTQGRIYQPEASTMTPEESQIIIVAQHLKAIQENNPTAPLYPPTVIDSQAGISQGADAGSGPPPP
jgi:hypothetical protein